jgi:hypothetical protein
VEVEVEVILQTILVILLKMIAVQPDQPTAARHQTLHLEVAPTALTALATDVDGFATDMDADGSAALTRDQVQTPLTTLKTLQVMMIQVQLQEKIQATLPLVLHLDQTLLVTPVILQETLTAGMETLIALPNLLTPIVLILIQVIKSIDTLTDTDMDMDTATEEPITGDTDGLTTTTVTGMALLGHVVEEGEEENTTDMETGNSSATGITKEERSANMLLEVAITEEEER